MRFAVESYRNCSLLRGAPQTDSGEWTSRSSALRSVSIDGATAQKFRVSPALIASNITGVTRRYAQPASIGLG